MEKTTSALDHTKRVPSFHNFLQLTARFNCLSDIQTKVEPFGHLKENRKDLIVFMFKADLIIFRLRILFHITNRQFDVRSRKLFLILFPVFQRERELREMTSKDSFASCCEYFIFSQWKGFQPKAQGFY